MKQDKDIRFTEKKVDSSWKEHIVASQSTAPEPSQQTQKVATSKIFLSLVQSLGIQALMHLGAIPNPMTNETEVNHEAAKEAIDLLMTLRDKTSGNLSPEEQKILDSLLSELQIKFSQSV